MLILEKENIEINGLLFKRKNKISIKFDENGR